MIEQYIKTTKCPYCDHPLNHGSNMMDGSNSTLNSKKRDSLTLGICYYCVHIIGYVNNQVIAVNDDLLDHIKSTKPQLYEQLLEAQKTLLEVKNEDK